MLARVYLYLGNYQKAFENAKKAFAVYNFLYDLNNTTLFSMVNFGAVQTEVYNGVTYSAQPQYPAISADNNSSNPNGNSNYWYKKAYFRFSS